MNTPDSSADPSSAFKTVRLLALDVDGVLTNGRVTPLGWRMWATPEASEEQSFCVKDGQGLSWLSRSGVICAWVTGRKVWATKVRARELGVTELHMGVKDKAEVLKSIQARLGISPDETIAVGDDLPDLALGRRAALLACPADAVQEVRARAGWISTRKGGQGAVRELAEEILRAKGIWEDLVQGYAGEE